jgi:rubrerythrin
MDLLPLIFAIIIPLGWAVIFYPFMRRAKKDWDILILIATLLSFSTLIFKEIIYKVDPDLAKTFAYVAGMLFGVAVLYFIFKFKSNWLEAPPEDDILFRNYQIETKIPMRHLFQVAIRLEGEGKDFYTMLAEKASDGKARKLWQELANDETAHKQLFENTLSRWLPRPADNESLDSLIKELRSRGLFSNPPLPDATEEEAVKYAIHNEEMTADFYLSFEKTFPDAWKKLHIQELVNTERQHAGKLRDLLSAFSVPLSAKAT